MELPIQLIPLVCLQCATPIPAGVDEVAWVCAQCGRGQLLDTAQGLAPLEIFFSTGIAPGATGRPFWVAEGRVSLERQTYAGNRNEEAQRFWELPRRFFIPAYNSSLETLLSEGVQRLNTPPELEPGPPARFEPVTLHPDDVQAAAEFIAIAVEAGRKDKLKEVRLSLTLAPPALWILP